MNKLYIKIGALFLGVILTMGVIVLYLYISSADRYAQEMSQKINRGLASHTVDMVKPHLKNGVIDTSGLEDIFHSMMVINPSVELYALDTNGRILSYVAPHAVVQLDKVDLNPIKEFLSDTQKVVSGDDPRNPETSNIFSAAPIYENGKHTGYIYIILASQRFASVAQSIGNSIILRFVFWGVLITMVLALITGLIAFWWLTRKVQVLSLAMKKFELGEMNTRVHFTGKDELVQMSKSFNQMADKIQQNIMDLEKLDSFRKEMISNISHDLRTPVSSIQGYAETLVMKKESISKQEIIQYADIIVKSSESLEKLVNDLFELTKLENGQVPFNPEPVSIPDLMLDICNKNIILAKNKTIQIDTIVEPDIPLAMADVSLIDRAIQNIVDNAIKYSGNNENITVEITCVSGEIKISIADSGPGIDPEDIPFVFERYYKNNKVNKISDSTGLGLAIVKKIVDLHGSSIQVFNAEKGGAVFEFGLPVVFEEELV